MTGYLFKQLWCRAKCDMCCHHGLPLASTSWCSAAALFDHLSSKPCRKSLDLVESLLRLSEVGQYEQVKQLFGFPIKHCPDMLVLALLQISTSWHTLRHELISTLMPIFLGNHPNSAIILHYAWHGQVGLRKPFKFDALWLLSSLCVMLNLWEVELWSSLKLSVILGLFFSPKQFECW